MCLFSALPETDSALNMQSIFIHNSTFKTVSAVQLFIIMNISLSTSTSTNIAICLLVFFVLFCIYVILYLKFYKQRLFFSVFVSNVTDHLFKCFIALHFLTYSIWKKTKKLSLWLMDVIKNRFIFCIFMSKIQLSANT